MGAPRQGGARRYLPLVYRVAAINAVVVIATVAVTLLVLDPHRLATVATDEAAVLALALALMTTLNLLMVRRVVRPLAELTELARTVDLTRPVAPLPIARSASEAGELATTFNQMLARLQAERRDATGRVLAGQESERLRIARELHDQIGQELTAVLLGLARIQATGEDPVLAEQVASVQELVRASLEDVRRIALELRPEALDELGLVTALAVLGERLTLGTGLTVTQAIEPRLPAVDPDAELVIYRVAQEALTNVARHAQTDRATLSLRREGQQLAMEVTDAGRGLAPGREPGTGIRGMRERAALVDGELVVGPGPGGRGCSVALRVQLAPDVLAASPVSSVERRDEHAADADPAGR